MSTKTAGMGFSALIIALIAIIALTGGEDGDTAAGGGTEVDAAFASEMAPHHISAIKMARVAQDRAEHPEIKQLADDIVSSQSSEIETLTAITDRLGEGDPDALGLSDEMMGMDMTMDAAELETAEPFDREFIDMMVPHHQSAILMARAELENGSDSEAMALAEDIIAAQSREIEEMNEWRTEWYGAPSPEGGVPEESSSASSEGAMPGMDM